MSDTAKKSNVIPFEQRLLTDHKGAAEVLGCGRSTFWKRVQDGLYPAPVYDGGSTRWLVREILEAKRAQEKNPDGVPPPPKKKVVEHLPKRPRSVPLGENRQHLYRHFDKDGKLLYVGISLSALARLAEHKKVSAWFWKIARVEITAYASRADVVMAERLTIKREKPLHNIVHAVRRAA